MSDLIEFLQQQDTEALIADAKALEQRWPALASKAYDIIAQRYSHCDDHQRYSDLAEACKHRASQQKDLRRTAYYELSVC